MWWPRRNRYLRGRPIEWLSINNAKKDRAYLSHAAGGDIINKDAACLITGMFTAVDIAIAKPILVTATGYRRECCPKEHIAMLSNTFGYGWNTLLLLKAGSICHLIPDFTQ